MQGLTASSLQQCIAALDTRRDETLHALFSSAKDVCAAPTDDPTSLATEAAYAAAAASLADRGLTEGNDALAHAAAVAAQHAGVVSQLQHALAAVSEVGAVARLQQRLAEYDALVAQGAFTDGAYIILELETAAAGVAGAEAIAAAIDERIRLFRDYVISAPPQYLTIDPTTYLPALIPPAQQTGAALAQVWDAAAALGVLPQALTNLSTSMVENCIKPILTTSTTAAVMESPAGSVASSALSAATTVRGGAAARAGAERALYRCFKSICEGALCGKESMVRQLGEIFWPAAANAYISAKLRPIKPVADSELAGFMRAGSLAAKLEQKAIKLGLWSTETEGPIAMFVRRTVGRVLADKRVRYAAAARDLLTSAAAKDAVMVSGLPTAPKTPSAGGGRATRALFGASGSGVAAAAAAELAGEPPVGDIGPYAVSRAAEGLVSLMHEALGEGSRSGSAALAQAMCGAVVDMAALLLALDPASSDQERALPYIAALRYNDCLHVYRALCTLPQSHSPRLQALVHPSVNFIAPAKRVRDAGEAVLAGMVTRQRGELLEIAGELRRWQGLDGSGVIKSNKAVRQVLAAFHRLGEVLRDVLPRGTFVSTTAELANSVCSTIADSILDMGDIAEEESQQIPQILGLLLDPGSGIISQAAGSSTSTNGSHIGGGAMPREGNVTSTTAAGAVPQVGCAQLAAELTAACVEIARLREVCELLDVPSREIAVRWRSGRLAGVGLTKAQVVGMVRALFEDNEYSRASMNAILESP